MQLPARGAQFSALLASCLIMRLACRALTLLVVLVVRVHIQPHVLGLTPLIAALALLLLALPCVCRLPCAFTPVTNEPSEALLTRKVLSRNPFAVGIDRRI